MEFKSALKMAEIAKSLNPKIKIVFGGPHVSNVPEESLKNKNIDFIFRAEAEEGFPQLIQELINNKKNPNFKKILEGLESWLVNPERAMGKLNSK